MEKNQQPSSFFPFGSGEHTRLPAEHKDDGEQRHQLQQVLADVRRHDSQLQEEEEEEGQRFVDVVPVHRHLSVHMLGSVERRHVAVA